jgi:hypothetical protein
MRFSLASYTLKSKYFLQISALDLRQSVIYLTWTMKHHGHKDDKQNYSVPFEAFTSSEGRKNKIRDSLVTKIPRI